MRILNFDQSPVLSYMFVIHTVCVISHHANITDRQAFVAIIKLYGTFMHLLWLYALYAWVWAVAYAGFVYGQLLREKGIWNGSECFLCSDHTKLMVTQTNFVSCIAILHLTSIGAGVYGYPFFKEYFDYIPGSQVYPRAVIERNAERDAEMIKPSKRREPVQFLFFFAYDGQSVLAYETKDCTVCHMPFEKGENIVVLRCKHLFHHKCMQETIKAKHTTCPVCRSDF